MAAKNVIIVFADESVVNDGYEHGQHLYYDILGTGDGIAFQNGNAVEIEWSKKNGATRMTFTDESGDELPIVRGKVFVEIVPTGNKVTY